MFPENWDDKEHHAFVLDNFVFYLDNGDLSLFNQYQWRVSNGYLQSRVNGKFIFLHRLLMNTDKGMVCDHINHNKQDNRKINLRNVTY
jgi:hypothetical protein